MNEVTKMFGAQPVRIVTKDETLWFVAKDVAEILGYSETNRMTSRLDEDEVGKLESTDLVDSSFEHGGARSFTIISESGLYNAVIGSKKPEAKAFRRWVTHEVLPSIRKTGQYAVRPEQQAFYRNITKEEIGRLLTAVEKANADDPKEKRDNLQTLFAIANNEGLVNQYLQNDYYRLMLQAVVDGRNSISPVEKEETSVLGRETAFETGDGSDPAEETQRQSGKCNANNEKPKALLISEGRAICMMKVFQTVVGKLPDEDRRELNGVPVPTFDTTCPLHYGKDRRYVNIEGNLYQYLFDRNSVCSCLKISE